MELERAYSLLTLKAVDTDRRTFTGLATTPDLDRHGHSVDPAGVTYANPLPLLFHHDRERPIGTVTIGKATADGIPFEATIPTIAMPGRLRDRVDEAWQSIQAGLIRGISWGGRILKDALEPLSNGGVRIKAVEILELSLVTIPANRYASILTVKSFAAGKDRIMTKTTAEQITAFENKRAAADARRIDLMQKAADAGVTLDPDTEGKEYDDLTKEIGQIDEHLVRLRALEQAQKAAAVPVSQALVPATPRSVISVRPNVPPGRAFVRGCMALAAAKGNRLEAIELSKQWRDSTPEVELWLKAAVTPGTTTDPAWAGNLVSPGNIAGDFIALMRPKTIIGRIPNLRMVPFNVPVPIQTAGGTYGWVGQGAPKPVTKLGFGSAILPITKSAGIIALSVELVRLSTPNAEDICQRDMVAGISGFLDQQFIDPAVAAVANVNPASITNGLTGTISSQDPLMDLYVLIAAATAANIPLAGSAVIMSETNAFVLGLMRDPNGNRRFPDVTAEGGTVEGMRLVPSNAAGQNVIWLQPDYILIADDGQVTVDTSTEASVMMDSAPVAGTTPMTSFWQNNLIGLRAERFINWLRGVTAGVQLVTGAAYTPPTASPATTTAPAPTQKKAA